VLRLTGVGSSASSSGSSPAEAAKEVVRQNNVIVGSRNADRTTSPVGGGRSSAAADRDWLARPIWRRLRPEYITDTLQRGPDHIKIVVDLGG
jgi:hypothetical protein